MIDEIHQKTSERLVAVNQRYTPLRRQLVEIMYDNGHPLSLPEILARDETFAQSSVYRNLSEMEVAGVVTRIQGADEHARYELTEVLTGHHHHAICAGCGKVVDIELDAVIEKQIDEALDTASRNVGFSPLGHRLDVIGKCADCVAKSN